MTLKTEADSPHVHGYHSHVYFDTDTLDQARRLCEEAAQRFDLRMGRVHERPVGPHPDWSCQLAYRPELLNQVLPWLAIHRQGLVIFTHPVTGNDLRDHRDHAIWMGAVRPLKLSQFEDRQDPVEESF
ncbi:DOPA 4,5-dioxygenase family protein [Pusillimonas sp. CC-YST705]|uniref:DOPA 4,5-dioxygenase family protein n=1 Tax=Mesopusillimonas faecipullorum TaxID=2755040 RepID=A0ABS8CDF0_9BURK|nr:DOPA 4,5-dioxygenase family protein [Mesopusillimonas faecipullorum]MCB5364060.1 DOPA 4,5-dioxygenase family protein [Mesopusillimonas faecipullorum]